MATYYSDEIIQAVCEANDIVSVVSSYMTLKRMGNSYKGLCPFHNEKTPSFNVSGEKQFYHCFGCGVGGNVITFVMEMEKLPFLEALRFLADRANIRLPEGQNAQADQQVYEGKKRLYELHRQAANFYYRTLKGNQEAMAYLINRGISLETIRTFGLGYATEDWSRLTDYLKTKAFTVGELTASGLATISENKRRIYDRFRSRVMFPILNPRGQIVGFGGRLMLQQQNAPKYLNSPETSIFSKSYELYNLNRCKNHLDDGRLLIVEGYMDVISLYEKGIKNTVAALGTAFTPYHAKSLERFAREVVIAFDGDKAGQSAAEKATNVLKKSKLNVKILVLPENEDPDSFVQKYGNEKFKMLVESALTVVEYELELLKQNNDLSQTDGRLHYGNAAIKILGQLKTPVEVDFYSRQVAQATGINQGIIRREVARLKKREPGTLDRVMGMEEDQQTQKIPVAYKKAQKLAMQYCLKVPDVIENFPADYLTDSFSKEFFEILLKKRKAGQSIEVNQLVTHFEEAALAKKMVEFVVNEDEISQSDYLDALEIMKRFYNEAQLEKLSNEIKRESAGGNDRAVARLTNQLIEIKKRMKESGR